jgi:hypothetical protein
MTATTRPGTGFFPFLPHFRVASGTLAMIRVPQPQPGIQIMTAGTADISISFFQRIFIKDILSFVIPMMTIKTL